MRHKKDEIELSDIEKEISILLAAIQSIKSMVNREVLMFSNDFNSMEIKPNTLSSSTLFSILLVDFISPPNNTFSKARSYLDALSQICQNPNFNHNNTLPALRNAVEEFDSWLSHEAHFENIWLPSINKELNLSMKREDLIYICGNISKHNQLRLDRVVGRILKILQKEEPNLKTAETFPVINDFYEWFHTDIFHYHLTKICEHLNNIIWGIQAYLMPEFNRSYTVKEAMSKKSGIEVYEYQYPKNVISTLGQFYYWELMNEIRAKPYINRFQTSKYLQGRY